MRLIDADELIKKWEVPKALPIPFADLICDAVIDAVKNAPTAETDLSGYSDRLYRNAYERGKAETLSKVIRCRDCSHFHKDDWYCDAWNNSPGFPKVTEDGFCNLADRREDG